MSTTQIFNTANNLRVIAIINENNCNILYKTIDKSVFDQPLTKTYTCKPVARVVLFFLN